VASACVHGLLTWWIAFGSELQRRSKRVRHGVGEFERLQRAVGVIVGTTRSRAGHQPVAGKA
jgi:hypothetical protein